ncbi:hypothetical protein ABT095_33735 [Kitasatospora sp. NPDC002227]|uniref:hypothetical protein n=1 Tax=Kitasatospora sp. NPDC002227 TaxID=3154773 RepID=UPI00332C3557
MARTTAAIYPRHPDKSRCRHRLTSRGKATVDECAGRGDYAADCSNCGETLDNSLKVVLEMVIGRHLREHTATTTEA